MLNNRLVRNGAPELYRASRHIIQSDDTGILLYVIPKNRPGSDSSAPITSSPYSSQSPTATAHTRPWPPWPNTTAAPSAPARSPNGSPKDAGNHVAAKRPHCPGSATITAPASMNTAAPTPTEHASWTRHYSDSTAPANAATPNSSTTTVCHPTTAPTAPNLTRPSRFSGPPPGPEATTVAPLPNDDRNQTPFRSNPFRSNPFRPFCP